MPGYVNTQTKKIIGVKKGTLEYFHERGHIAYANSESGIKTNYYQGVVFHITIVLILMALLVDVFRLVAPISFLLYLLFDLYEEQWCWNYARTKLSRYNKKS
jgi:hypothetical protein